jgi:adenylate kinase
VNYIFLGPPGSGKGTQAQKIAEKLKLFYFGAGDLMREEAELGTELGKKFKAVWDRGKGELIDPEIVNQFVKSKLLEIGLNKAFIFDGYPRSIVQANFLEEIFKNSSAEFKVININVSAENLIERMETRKVCEACSKVFFKPEENGIRNCDVCGGNLIRRQEDQPDVIRERIKVYDTETKPLISYYKEKGILIDIDGEPPIEKVTEEIEKVVE